MTFSFPHSREAGERVAQVLEYVHPNGDAIPFSHQEAVREVRLRRLHHRLPRLPLLAGEEGIGEYAPVLPAWPVEVRPSIVEDLRQPVAEGGGRHPSTSLSMPSRRHST